MAATTRTNKNMKIAFLNSDTFSQKDGFHDHPVQVENLLVEFLLEGEPVSSMENKPCSALVSTSIKVMGQDLIQVVRVKSRLFSR